MDGILAIIGVFGTPVFIVWAVMLFQWKKEQARNQLIVKALELGKEIDPALLVRNQVNPKKDPSMRLLTWGMILISLGLAAFGSLSLLTELEWASLSALLLFPGVGLLVVYALTRKNKEK